MRGNEAQNFIIHSHFYYEDGEFQWNLTGYIKFKSNEVKPH